MSTEQIIQAALVIGFLVLSLGIHEAAHAWAAYKLGDNTAERMGRMTLNPIPHIDPFMTILLPAFLWFSTGGRFVFGGAKPVPVYKQNLRKPNRDMALVAIAGPASNVVLAVLFMLAWKTAGYKADFASHSLLMNVLFQSTMFNILLALFNLLPIPPLDGSRVLAYLLPTDMRDSYVQLERFGLLLVIGFIYLVPGVREGLGDSMIWCFNLLDDATGGPW